MSIKPRAEINLKEADGFIQSRFKKLLVDCVAKLVVIWLKKRANAVNG